MRSATIAFAAGIGVCQLATARPSLWFFSLIPAIWLIGRRWQLRRAGALALWIGAGVIWSLWRADSFGLASLPAHLDGTTDRLVGVVVSVPDQTPDRTRFRLMVTRAPGAFAILEGATIQLAWYRDAPAIAPGSLWQLRAKLRRPRGLLSPGAFDAALWARLNGIAARGYVTQGALLGVHRSARTRLAQWRVSVRDIVSAAVDDPLTRGLLVALSVGIRADVSPATWRVFQRSGTAHLLAISGLHVGLLAGFAYWVARLGWPLVPILGRHWCAPQPAAVAAMCAALGYAALAGFAVPTQRALIMVIVAMGAVLIHRQLARTQALALAAFAILVLEPANVLSLGFWFSFLAVGILLWCAGCTHIRGWRRWLLAHLAVCSALLPLTLGYVGSQSLWSPLINALSVPWVSICVIPPLFVGLGLTGLGLEGVGAIGIGLAAAALRWLWWGLDAVVALPPNVSLPIHPAALPLGAISVLLIATVGVFWWFAPLGVPGRRLAWVLWLPLLIGQPERTRSGTARLSLLDVGQGLAAVVETRHHVAVYDAGANRMGYDMGAAVVSPYLRRQSWRRIDELLASHDDNDHAGGIVHLAATFNPRRITANPRRFAGAEACEAGRAWRVDGVRFQIVWPPTASERSRVSNNGSCVLRVLAGKQVAFLSGDIEASAERTLVGWWGASLAADVLVVPHHGSDSSSSVRFLTRIQPKIALASVGWLNRYGMPDSAVVARYRARGVEWWSTAESGALHVTIGRPPRRLVTGPSPPRSHRPIVDAFAIERAWWRRLGS
ncbi:MAG: DNA internalization-related competence protein ComEC/Rec2 [Pseudomonadota bacterium]